MSMEEWRERGVKELKEGTINNVGIDIDFGGSCNLKCVECYERDPELELVPKKFIEVDWLEKILFDARDVGAKEIYYLGKDTLYHPKIVEMTEKACDLGFYTLLITNGVRFGYDEKLCRKIADVGAGVVQQLRVIGDDENTAEVLGHVQGIPKENRKYHLQLINKSWSNVMKYFPKDKIIAQSCLTRSLAKSGQAFKVYEFCREKILNLLWNVLGRLIKFFRGVAKTISP